MKKLFLILLSIFIISCTKDEINTLENLSLDKKIEEYKYIYEGKTFSLQIDFSEKNKPKIIEGRDNENLKQIFELRDLVSVVNGDDLNIFYLYDNLNVYKKSDVYKKSIETLAENQNIEKNDNFYGVKVFRDRNFAGPSQVFSTSQYNLHTIYMPVDGRIWGDNITSLKLSGAFNLGIYKDARYTDRSTFINSYGRLTEYRDLEKLTYGSWPFGVRNWNDDISSFRLYRR